MVKIKIIEIFKYGGARVTDLIQNSIGYDCFIMEIKTKSGIENNIFTFYFRIEQN